MQGNFEWSFKVRMKTIHIFLNLQGRRRELVKAGILSKRTGGLNRNTQGKALSFAMVLTQFKQKPRIQSITHVARIHPKDFSMFKKYKHIYVHGTRAEKTIINHMVTGYFFSSESRLIKFQSLDELKNIIYPFCLPLHIFLGHKDQDNVRKLFLELSNSESWGRKHCQSSPLKECLWQPKPIL